MSSDFSFSGEATPLYFQNLVKFIEVFGLNTNLLYIYIYIYIYIYN